MGCSSVSGKLLPARWVLHALLRLSARMTCCRLCCPEEHQAPLDLPPLSPLPSLTPGFKVSFCLNPRPPPYCLAFAAWPAGTSWRACCAGSAPLRKSRRCRCAPAAPCDDAVTLVNCMLRGAAPVGQRLHTQGTAFCVTARLRCPACNEAGALRRRHACIQCRLSCTRPAEAGLLTPRQTAYPP